MRKLWWVLLIAGVSCCGGCASVTMYPTREGMDFEKDKYECETISYANLHNKFGDAGDGGLSNTPFLYGEMKRCLESKGWVAK